MDDKIKLKGEGKTIATGQASQGLKEPVPFFSRRTGEKVIRGKINNNARIVIGQDRDSFSFGPNGKAEVNATDPDQDSKESGYSGHHGAGAIDLVVGSGAPYPSDLERLGLPNSLGPVYRTLRDPKLSIFKLADESNHEGYVMDAARIYISQKTDVDSYFGITDIKMGPTPDQVVGDGPSGFSINLDVKPSSAIVLKSDKVRIHARRDIKIIAGGDIDVNGSPVKIDSNGNIIKTIGGGIHLIAGNGTAGFTRQEPIPLGFKLAEIINQLTATLHDIIENQNLLLKSQMVLDTAVANSIRVSPAGPSAPDPISQIADVVDKFTKVTAAFNAYFMKFFNMPTGIDKRIKPFSEKYFLSRYNTTN